MLFAQARARCPEGCDKAGGLKKLRSRAISASSTRGPLVADQFPLGLDAPPEFLDAERAHQDLDARLGQVVAPAFQVVDAQDGLEIRQQVLARQEVAHHLADDGRAAEAAAGENLEAQLAVGSAHDVHADVMHQRGGAILRRAGDRDLELARQIGEFRMEGRPLADELAPGPRILQLIRASRPPDDRRWCCGCNCRWSGWRASRLRPARPGCPGLPRAWASCTGCSGAW